jgi:predicted ATP-binding protein involved in virulence
MKILKLELQNFRCFDEETFEFSENFNVLIGDNATGKTVILDALAISVGSFFLGIDAIHPENISKSGDIRRVTKIKGETPTVEKILPVVVSSKGFFESEGKSHQLGLFQLPLLKENASWSRELKTDNGRTTRENAREIEQYARDLQQKSRSQDQEGNKVILPVISYYGTGRLWVQKKQMQTTKTQTLPKGSRFRGYENCLTNSHEIKKLMQWFKTWELSSLQTGKMWGTLAGVKEAIKNCMEDWEDVRFDVRFDELMATSKKGNDLPFQMLSDGVRNMIGMVADIAYRCVTLNPQFEAEAARLTPGIVLIDEIELHLHPKWQRRVVEDLKRTFPKIQFIVTTHSPFIIQSLHPNEDRLINLNTSPPTEYAGRSIEDIIEDIMGIELPQYSRRKLAMLKAAEEYFLALNTVNKNNHKEVEELKARLDQLIVPFADDPAYHAFLNMKRASILGE